MSVASSYYADYANKIKSLWVEALKAAVQDDTVLVVIKQMEEFYFEE